MQNAARTKVSVQTDDFDVAAETAALTVGLTNVGAIVTFTGVCRDEGGTLAALELEHSPDMAEAEIGRIVEEAAERWDIQALAAVHRTGRIAAGEQIVLVVAVAGHRAAAFEAAGFVMDFLKTAAPIWKKQHFADGSATEWVEGKPSDDAALLKWQG